jgi:LmbE family N-acetylglucosaminyl deacetylase
VTRIDRAGVTPTNESRRTSSVRHRFRALLNREVSVRLLSGLSRAGAVTLVLLVALASARAQEPTAAPSGRTLLAVFAHPDDETMVGPLLAHYARQPNTRVHLAIVTNGDKGVTPFAKIPAGEALAAARATEAACACTALGAQPPILLGFPDGGLASMQVLAKAAAQLKSTIDRLRPDAIVTWGPDGGYGHPDHRLVSAIVTQIVQAGEATPALFYAGLPKSRMDADAIKELHFPAPFAPVVDKWLNVRVPYTPEDAARAKASLACHASQFTPGIMALITTLTDRVHQGRLHLRSWDGGPERSDVFAP